MLTKIYFFSGTGNNLWSAKKIANIISEGEKDGLDFSESCELYNIGSAAEQDEIIIEADAVVIVFPSYAYGLPRIVRRFVKKAIFKTPYLASFVTYGSSPKGTLGAMRRILKKKGIEKLFFGHIAAVENYLAIFGTPKPATIVNRVLMQERETEEAARAVITRKENKVFTFRPFSSFVSILFYLGLKVFYKKYRIGKNCNACASCEKMCPVSAIVMKDGKPVFTKKCEHCQGCVNICPQRAIQFGRVKHGSPGYCHPGIDLRDLSNRR